MSAEPTRDSYDDMAATVEEYAILIAHLAGLSDAQETAAALDIDPDDLYDHIAPVAAYGAALASIHAQATTRRHPYARG